MRRSLPLVLALALGCASPESPEGSWEVCRLRVHEVPRRTPEEPLQFVVDGTVFRADGSKEIEFTVATLNETDAFVGIISRNHFEIRQSIAVGNFLEGPPYEGAQARIRCRRAPDGKIGIDIDLGIASSKDFRLLGTLSRILTPGETMEFFNPESF